MTIQNDGSAREPAKGDAPVKFPTPKSAIARRARYAKPRRFFRDGNEYFEDEAIEIDVETDVDYPPMGTGLALLVGKTVVLDSERLAERRYRFFAPPSTPVPDDAPVALARGGTGVPVPEGKGRVRLQWETAPRSAR
jgi:hypothetical protein